MEDARMRILEMLQAGKLTVEQAAQLLAAVEQPAKAEAAPEPAPKPEPGPAQDWGQFGRDLAAQVQQGLQEMRRHLGTIGPDREVLSQVQQRLRQEVQQALNSLRGHAPGAGTGAPTRENYTQARLTRNALSRMHDGTSYTNYGLLAIADDVPEDLVKAKITSFTNYGQVTAPEAVIAYLQKICDENFGRFAETGEAEEEGEQPARKSYGSVSFTQEYLSRMRDGTLFANYGTVTVSPDVSRELLDQKLAAYKNYGTTVMPESLLGYFEDRFTSSNHGRFVQAREGDERGDPAILEAPADAHSLFTEEIGGRISQLAVTCHAGNLAFHSAEDGPLELKVSRPAAQGKAEDWLQQVKWEPHQEGPRFTFILGNPDDLKATEGLTFHVSVPKGIAVIAETRAGDITAHEIEGQVDLTTRGGDVIVEEIEGGVTVETAGGDIHVNDIAGGVAATTGGGDVSISDTEGGVTAKTGGGDIEVSDVEGGVTVETGGGDLSLSDIKGGITARTGGGDIEMSDVEGGVMANTGAGGIELSEIAGDATAETGSGDISATEIAGTVRARTGSGDIHVQEVGGDAILETASGDVSLDGVAGEVTVNRGR